LASLVGQVEKALPQEQRGRFDWHAPQASLSRYLDSVRGGGAEAERRQGEVLLLDHFESTRPADYEIGPLFNPPLHRDNELGKRGSLWCPGDVGGVNIDGPAAADPASGILYVTSRKGCTSRLIAPGTERDKIENAQTGTNVAAYAVLRAQGPRGPADLSLFKPPYSRITAIDMNTGEHLWWIPVGETPDRVKNHPLLTGVDVGETGTGRVATMIVTPTLLIYQGEASDGTPHLYAVDKRTGKQVGTVEVEGVTSYGMMTYVHEGRQYIMLQTGPTLTAVALPAD
jgi:quinoprotein glucose dehydrogenase